MTIAGYFRNFTSITMKYCQYFTLVCALIMTEIVVAQNKHFNLYNKFRTKTSQFKAVSFTVKEMHIYYQSFDLGKRDTTIKESQYFGVRNGDQVYYYIEMPGSQKHGAAVYSDTAAYKYSDLYAEPAEEYLFADGLTFLGRKADTFMYAASDSFSGAGKSAFGQISDGFNEMGHYRYESTFTFDNRGYLLQQESYFDQDSVIPKVYTLKTYSKVTYYTTVPAAFETKINNAFKTANKAMFRPKSTILLHYMRDSSRAVTEVEKKMYGKNSLADFDAYIRKHKITVVYFWFLGCKPCMQFKPELLKIYEEYHSLGLNIIALNDIDPESYLDSMSQPYDSFHDRDGIGRSLLVDGYPTILVFDSGNHLLARMTGFTEHADSELRKHLAELLEN